MLCARIALIWLLLMRAGAGLIVAVFAVNLLLSRPVLDSLLFSRALAIGSTAQIATSDRHVHLDPRRTTHGS